MGRAKRIKTKALLELSDDPSQIRLLQARAQTDAEEAVRPPVWKKRKNKKPRVELNDVMSSPRDNEADHDDRPTTQEDEEEEDRRE